MKSIKKIIVVLVLILFAFPVFSQIEKVQAAFIFNFTKYMEWPASAKSGNFVIGVLNSSAMQGELSNMVAGKAVGTQSIKVESFSSAGSVGDCHILYVPENQTSQLNSVKSKLSGKSTLIVTSGEGLAASVADIAFVLVGGKQNFELNKRNITGKGITVNARLEQLASKVY